MVGTTLVLSEEEKVLLLFSDLMDSASLDSARLFLVALLFDEDDNVDDPLVVFDVHTKTSFLLIMHRF